MTPQFVDFDADGYNDMLMATFEGHVFVVKGSKEGYLKPEVINDRNGDKIRISMYWDDDASDYKSVDRSIDGEKSDPSHHMTSAVAVDWDNDDDLDLLLGAYEGGLYWCENEGTKSEPKFSVKNRQVKAAGKHLVITGGLATPIIADWNKDGRFDIICGGASHGVYLFENKGDKGKPEFDNAKVLIGKTALEASEGDESDHFGMMNVKTKNGLPVGPGKSFHVDVLDYDSDGHMDILVGAQSYIKEEEKELSKKEEEELNELNKKMEAFQTKMTELYDGKSQEELKELFKTEQMKKLQEEMMPLFERMSELQPYPRAKEFVWLYRNKGVPSTEATETALPSNTLEPKTNSKQDLGDTKISIETKVAVAEDSNKIDLELKIAIPVGYHIYGSKDANSPSKMTITDLGGLKGESKILLPTGKLNMSKGAPQYWLQDMVTVRHQLKVPDSYKGGTVKGQLDYMICDENKCMPPSKMPFEIVVSTK